MTDFKAVSSRLSLWNIRSCKPPSRPQVSWTCPSSAHSGGFFLPLLLGRGSGSGFLPRHTDEEHMQLRLLLMLQTIRRTKGSLDQTPPCSRERSQRETEEGSFHSLSNSLFSFPNLAFASSSRPPSTEVNKVSHINAGVHSKAERDHICCPAADSCPQISSRDERSASQRSRSRNKTFRNDEKNPPLALQMNISASSADGWRRETLLPRRRRR